MTGNVMRRKTLIQGGTLLTMVPGETAYTGDLLFSDQGIEAVSSTLNKDPSVEIVNAKGCYVLPGFVQSHVHFCQTLFRGRAEQVPLMDWLQNFIWPMEAAHDEFSLRVSAQLTLAELLLGGTTAALDMGTVHHTHVLFEEAIRAGFRLVTGKAMMDRGPDPMGGLLESTQSSLEMADALATKWHGAADGLVQYAFAPRFILSCTDELMKETVSLARKHHALIHTHASENPGELIVVKERYGTGNIGALADLGMVGEDVVLAHCVLPDEGEMELLRSSRTGVAHCPSTNLKLASGVAPIPEYLDAGVRVGVGADGAPCNNRLDMFAEMRMAGLIQKPRRGADALPAKSILEMATRGGADLLGLGSTLGQLKVGMQADIQIVNPAKPHLWPLSDPYTHLVYSAQPHDVSHVWVRGQPKVVDGALLGWDLVDLQQQSHKAINELMERLASP
jgi:5-methylthioadenosine/S-adenosylhomocysteine deaminase